MGIRLNGATSGYVELQAPAVAGSTILTLPTDSITPGMVLVATATASAAASVSINNCFTSAYDNYRIVLTSTGSVANRPVLRLRVSGVDAATNYSGRVLDAYSTSSISAQVVSAAYLPFIYDSQSGAAYASMDVLSPFLAAVTGFLGSGIDSNNDLRIIGGRHTTASSYDGFTLLPDSSGTITGSVRVYGYRNA